MRSYQHRLNENADIYMLANNIDLSFTTENLLCLADLLSHIKKIEGIVL